MAVVMEDNPMTPQERQQVDALFDRLATLETAPRDRDAAAAIAEGLARAPNAVYALVQTVLLQQEALHQAQSRIEELGGAAASRTGGSFLDTMRDAIWGGAGSRTSVPSVSGASPSRGALWNSANRGQPAPQAAPWTAPPETGAPGAGGSFLGTAAAAAAGVIGGSLLFNSLRSMMGGSHQGFGAPDAFGRGPSDQNRPWNDAGASGDLARDAGINDIGRGGERASFFDNNPAGADHADNQYGEDSAADDSDVGDSDFGDSDFGGGGDSTDV
jgi:hypothetical protein